MSFNGKVAELRKLAEAMEQLAPKDSDGKLVWPYRDWVKKIRRDIAAAESWAERMAADAKKSRPESG